MATNTLLVGLAWIATVLVGALLRGLFSERAESLAGLVVRLAVLLMPPKVRNSRREEWQAVLLEVDGPHWKLLNAFGFFVPAATAMGRHLGEQLFFRNVYVKITLKRRELYIDIRGFVITLILWSFVLGWIRGGYVAIRRLGADWDFFELLALFGLPVGIVVLVSVLQIGRIKAKRLK